MAAKRCENSSCLGGEICEEWNCCENDSQMPESKRSKLSLKKRRFAQPLAEVDMNTLCKPVVPSNTRKQTDWCVNVFESWRSARDGEKCPANLLQQGTVEELNFWLCRFVVEARRSDGKWYPSATLYQLLAGLLRYARSYSADFPNFLDKSDLRFCELRAACDNVARQLRKDGVGAEVKHAEVFTSEEEAKLWESGTIGITSPLALVRAVFFYVGKTLCLRGGQEQRDLKPSQFCRKYDPDRYVYVENGSKNHPGGFGSGEQSNKIVTLYNNQGFEPQCVVYLLDFYFSKCPQPAKTDAFYLRPLPKRPSSDGEPWFASIPLGKNKLALFVKEMCKDANISGNKTNHSLRATGTTAMLAAGVPEKLVKSITGHKSTKVYERPTVEQKKAVLKVLTLGEAYAPQSTAAQCTTPHSTTPQESSEVGQLHMVQVKSATQKGGNLMGTMFSGLNGCTINITPHNFVVNIHPNSQSNE